MSADNKPEPSEVSAAPAERRRNLRFPFSATVEAVDLKSGAKVTGRTSDLGLGGCYVDAMSTFPTGTEVKIRIVRDAETFEAQARVIYSQTGMGMGLAFVSAQPKQIRLFQRWVLEISGKAKAAPKETAHPEEPEPAPAHRSQTLGNVVLSDLIVTLMQKKILTEREGKELLRKLFV